MNVIYTWYIKILPQDFINNVSNVTGSLAITKKGTERESWERYWLMTSWLGTSTAKQMSHSISVLALWEREKEREILYKNSKSLKTINNNYMQEI